MLMTTLILAFGCSLAFFLVHAAIFVAAPVKYRFSLMSRIFYAFMGVYAVLFFFFAAGTARDKGLHFFNGLFIYCMLYVGYLIFYFTADRSMTIRIRSQDLNRLFHAVRAYVAGFYRGHPTIHGAQFGGCRRGGAEQVPGPGVSVPGRDAFAPLSLLSK
jgi:hypothetical protein